MGASNITLPVTSKLTFARNGVTVRAYDVGRRSARLEIIVERMTFYVSESVKSNGMFIAKDTADGSFAPETIHSSSIPSRISSMI